MEGRMDPVMREKKQVTLGCELLIQLLHPIIVSVKLPKDPGVTGENELILEEGMSSNLTAT